MRQAEQRCGSPALQVVVRADQIADASGMLDGSVDVAVEEGQSGSVHRSHAPADGGMPRRRTTIGESSRTSQDSTISSSGSTPSTSPVAMRAPTSADGEHRTVLEHLGGEGFEPAPQLRLLTRPLHRRRSQFDQLRGRARVVGGEGVDDRFAELARRRRTSRSRGGAARRPGRAARRPAGRAATSPKRWWYRYQRAAIVEGDEEHVRPVELARASPWRRPAGHGARTASR